MGTKASWRFEPGEQIVPGRHAVRRLGGGSRFEVYLATDDRLMETVVAKVLRPDRAGDARALRALRREAGRLSSLAHPRIVRLFAVEADGPRPHLVLEHLEGPTLRALIRDAGAVAADQAVPIAIALCSVLHYLRAEGIVHLDVKPGNVVIGIGPTLVDFSVARRADEATVLKRPVGTAAYMAPEQCVAGSNVGPPADVWGLGVTLYEALSGRRPFDASTEDRPYPQLDAEPAPLPRGVAPGIAEQVLACLRPEPAARPTPAELAAALEPAQAALPRVPKLGRSRPRLG